MLTQDKANAIRGLLAERPRSIKEISLSLGMTWKTANKYIEELCGQDNSIGVHVFKDGMRGGLKIAFLNSTRQDYEQLLSFMRKRILGAREKSEFSPFELYQHVDGSMKKAFWEGGEAAFLGHGTEDIDNLLQKSEKEYLSFSGDFSWVMSREKGKAVFNTIGKLAEKGVGIHMLGRIDVKSLASVERLMRMNEGVIDVRHVDQPLRGAIVDDTVVRLVETPASLDKKIYYEITEPKWVRFVKSVFWEFHKVSVPADKRIDEIRKLI